MTEETPPPPEGFVEVVRGPFSHLNGPLFNRPVAPPHVEYAVFLRPRHMNAAGVLHGGMLSTFLDILLGSALAPGCGRSGVTVQLSVNFLRMARPGEWLQGRAHLTHATRDLAFCEGRAFVGSRDVGHATGVFKLMNPPRTTA